MILPEIDLKGARLLSEKVRLLVSKQHFTFDKTHIPVTMSLGIAVLKPEHREAAELVRAADERLYEAKTTGRNRVCG